MAERLSYRRARDRQRGLRARRRGLRRARGRPRRPRDQGLAPGVQLREGAGRHPGRVRRRRLARAARRGRLQRSHETADMRLVEVLTGEAQARSTGSRSSGSSSRARTAATASPAAAARRQAPAPGRRPHRPRDHEGAARRVRGAASGTRFANSPLRRARAGAATAGARRVGDARRSTPATVVLAAGGRCYAEAEERGELSTNHPNATGEVTRIALDARRRGARPGRAPVPPERRRLAARRCRATRSPRRRARTAPCC